MSLNKLPVKGMYDILPSDLELRNNLIDIIKSKYSAFGFMQIETPSLERIENLTSNEGGENEKLIFKVLKRGKDLEKALLENQYNFADSGLRYDLTLPLARYFANNMASLPIPFRSLQIGNVWRAENPQKGRLRQFIQCDIDILGDSSTLSEIELITATSSALSEIFKNYNIGDVSIQINDRQILYAMCKKSGFTENQINNVLISLDKLDKIGIEGVKKELLSASYQESCVNNYLENFTSTGKPCSEFCQELIDEGFLEKSVIENLSEIIESSNLLTHENINVKFCPSLVRGMGYYTGTIFEITIPSYNFSIGGGGRYDNMIGKFSGQKIPACGFSLGFERIFTILNEKFRVNTFSGKNKKAILLDKKIANTQKVNILKSVKEKRDKGENILVELMRKNLKQQISMLEKEGYTDFQKIYAD